MKFGLYSSIANPPRGEHLDRCIDEVIAEAQLAEASGFDSCFFGEHHQDQDGFLPSPLIVAAAVAARTQRLRVGTSVILLPLHHPVRVAEDAITLDLVSKGRVILGVGIGYQPADFRAFAVPMEDRLARFEEGVEILRLCWAGEPFSFRGKHYTLADVQIRPRPFQRPGPPLWIGASIPAAARRAGRVADGFVGTPSTSLDHATRLAELYKEAARDSGRPPQVIQMRDAWVAPTRAETDAVYGPHVMTAYRYYWEHRLAEFRDLRPDTPFTLENLAPDRLVLGDPETCVREFQRWQKATGADYFLLRLRHAHSGGPPHEKIMAAIKLFGERVLPHCGQSREGAVSYWTTNA
jgi:probable F420-dependent oxidoreductase